MRWSHSNGCCRHNAHTGKNLIMNLPLEPKLKIGVQTIHRRTEPATGSWLPLIDEMSAFVELVDGSDFDSLWVGDHISFPVAILDPLLQLAQAAVVSRRLVLGTAVYLLPLRHPAPAAKQLATLDHLTEGRLIVGVGVGGEFPKEYEVCGVPLKERGARLSEAIPMIRSLWSGAPASHDAGLYPAFEGVTMQPPPRQPGGPPIWCGGRSDGALRRTGRLGDGWLAYVVTPEMYGAAMKRIASAAIGRSLTRFGAGLLLFTRLARTYEEALEAATITLSQRYAMDFRRPAERYAALGPPQQVAERIRAFYAAGVRHVSVDFVGPYEERHAQIEWFGRDVLPLLADLR
jgi:alkanesulfonate monooxygenase SsuD/methylene tetrahydromethanopterin reductase-like flavin-dependent oxidoreductase (luciferase family)